MRVEDPSPLLHEYAQGVLMGLDRSGIGRINLQDANLKPNQQWFLRAADKDLDGYVDKYELEAEIAFRVDVDSNRRIDDSERADAEWRYGLPNRTVDFGF